MPKDSYPVPDFPSPEELGPKMMALKTDQMRLFVWCYSHNGGNASQAARDAGYSQGVQEGAHTTGWRLLQRPNVLEAIHECTWKFLGQTAVAAAAALKDMVADPNHKDHAKAVLAVLDRSGFIAKTEHKVTVEHQVSEEELIRRIVNLAAKHKLDPDVLLGSAAPKQLPPPLRSKAVIVVDAEEIVPDWFDQLLAS